MKLRNSQANIVALRDGFKLYGYADQYMFRTLVRVRTWEPATAAVIRQELKVGGTFIDAGGGLGFYTALARRLVGPKGKVLSFEPHPENYRCILLSVEALKKVHNVAVYAAALGSAFGTARLWTNPGNEGDNRLDSVEHIRMDDSFDVVVLPLDSLNIEPTGPVVMKMDVQGAECDVLLGAAEFCARYQPVIVAENNDTLYGDALTVMLDKMGYVVTPIRGKDVVARPK